MIRATLSRNPTLSNNKSLARFGTCWWFAYLASVYWRACICMRAHVRIIILCMWVRACNCPGISVQMRACLILQTRILD